MDVLVFTMFTACSFLPEQVRQCHSMIHNIVLAKCWSPLDLHQTLSQKLQAEAREGLSPKTLNPKHLIGTLGTKHPCGGPWPCWRGGVGNLRSGLSVKKQLLYCIMFKQTIQLTSFLSQISLSCSGGSNKLYHLEYVCFCQMNLWNWSLSICF